MLINNNSNGLQILKKDTSLKENIFLDLDKHYPFFKLFDLCNIKEGIHTYGNYLDEACLKSNSYSRYNIKKYNNIYLKYFLNDYRDTNINNSVSGTYKYKIQTLDILGYSNLKTYNISSSYNISYCTYTLRVNNNFVYCLCIKPEYIYYVKLCYLAQKEIEFNCFYILVRKNIQELISFLPIKKLYNLINKNIKNYNCEVHYVDSIEAELGKNISLPKFNTTKDYTNWLNNIKEGFIRSITPDIVEPIEYPF